MEKSKTFDQYFQECIQDRKIPLDTPPYLRKALERAMREYDHGIIQEKSAFEGFANKYIIEGRPGLFPLEFFRSVKRGLEGVTKKS